MSRLALFQETCNRNGREFQTTWGVLRLFIKPRIGEPVRILNEAVISELPNYYRGKVRENYDLPDGNRIIISTDRLSAFDRILTCIPYKGQVLTQTARYWFEQTKDICPNHVVSYPDPNVVIGKRLDILPVEVVVRGVE